MYELIKENEIEVLKFVDGNGITLWIPLNPLNADYQVYLESLNDNTETK